VTGLVAYASMRASDSPR